VYRELERLRAASDIGSGLEAEVDLYAPSALARELERLGDELRFVLITSEARVQPLEARPEAAVRAELRTGGELWIGVRPSAHGKCVRCWHLRLDVGAHAEHPELCGRCVENVAGAGEVRRYA
jgi:isoleucyl-tRNA synthetase